MVKKLISMLLVTFITLGISGFAEAATSGGKNTVTINVQTQD